MIILWQTWDGEGVGKFLESPYFLGWTTQSIDTSLAEIVHHFKLLPNLVTPHCMPHFLILGKVNLC